jgi:hypothetical protein
MSDEVSKLEGEVTSAVSTAETALNVATEAATVVEHVAPPTSAGAVATDLTEAVTLAHTPAIEALENWVATHIFGTSVSANTDVLNSITRKVSEITTILKAI